MGEVEKKRWLNLSKFTVPHTYVIIFCIIVLAAVLTHIIPPGAYDNVTNDAGINMVDPMSYHAVDPAPAKVMTVFDSVMKGMKASASLIFFVFIIGGSFQIITATKVLDIGINRLVLKLEGKEKLIIPIFLAVFSAGGAMIGMATECIVFIPIGVALSRRLGYDSIVGAAMIILGAACGFTSGVMNPYSVAVAQTIAELPLFSGMGLRIILLAVLLTVTSVYVMRYAEKVKRDPRKSVVYELEQSQKDEEVFQISTTSEMGLRHCLVAAVVAIGFTTVVIGVAKFKWTTDNMASVFLIMGIASGLVGGIGPSQIADEFIKGVKTVVFGSIVIGIARAVLVVLQDGMILDTMVHALAIGLQGVPSQFTAVGMFLVQTVINFFIPSGSGQASTTMPILIPLADITGVMRQVTVLAFQLGDGITNSINPTSSSLNSSISVAQIPYARWVKFAAPLIGVWTLIGLVFVAVASVVGYGPF